MSVSKKFWRNKTIAISGANGFLGSKLVEKIQELNVNTKLIKISSSRYDLRLQSHINRFFKNYKPDYIFHLAANVGGIGANLKNPANFFYDNASMGINFLHYSYINNVKKFLATATVCAYPEKTSVPFKEKDIWNGYPEPTNAPYGIAKKILSVQSKAYRHQHNFNSIVIYPVNLYGPGDNFEDDSSHVIPALIKKIYNAKINNLKSVDVWGSGIAKREFLYVDDLVTALIRAMEKYNSSEPVNIGTGSTISIKDLVKKISHIMRYNGKIKWIKSKPNGQLKRQLDISKAKEKFGFKSSIDLDQGLENTINWYLNKQVK